MPVDVQLGIGKTWCTLRLLEDRAPRLASAFLELIPLTSFASHAKFAGAEIIFMVPRLWEPESLVSSVQPGDVGYYADRQTICLFYGSVVSFGQVGVFGRIVDGLGHLQAAGPRIWEGQCMPIHVKGVAPR